MTQRTFLDGRVTLFHDDCRAVLKTLADNSVDSVVTDPPYHLTSIVKRFGGENAKPVKSNVESPGGAPHFQRLTKGFMGKQWDGGDIAFQPELWAEVLRVLKPGGYIMAFSGCRTYHRMACAIEDAGFITHPFFAFCFGSGFPKAHNVSKQIDKAAGYWRGRCGGITIEDQPCKGTEYERTELGDPITEAAREWDGWFYGTQSLKPALEPIFFGQKPFERGLNGGQNVMKWGTGAINVAWCKVPGGRPDHGWAQIGSKASDNVAMSGRNYARDAKPDDPLGRWPANLILSPDKEVLACFPETEPGSAAVRVNKATTQFGFGDGKPEGRFSNGVDDSGGSAARFFASFPRDDVKRIFYTSKADNLDRLGSRHPTVKPLDLLQYLIRLITPRGGLCLDLFAGTGTTAEASFREGFRCILIEREAEYIADIERRMSLVMEGPVTRANAGMKARGRPGDDGPLFGGTNGDDVSRSKYGRDGESCKFNLTNATFGGETLEQVAAKIARLGEESAE